MAHICHLAYIRKLVFTRCIWLLTPLNLTIARERSRSCASGRVRLLMFHWWATVLFQIALLESTVWNTELPTWNEVAYGFNCTKQYGRNVGRWWAPLIITASLYTVFIIFTPAPWEECEWDAFGSVCVSICLSVRMCNSKTNSLIDLIFFTQ